MRDGALGARRRPRIYIYERGAGPKGPLSDVCYSRAVKKLCEHAVEFWAVVGVVIQAAQGRLRPEAAVAEVPGMQPGLNFSGCISGFQPFLSFSAVFTGVYIRFYSVLVITDDRSYSCLQRLKVNCFCSVLQLSLRRISATMCSRPYSVLQSSLQRVTAIFTQRVFSRPYIVLHSFLQHGSTTRRNTFVSRRVVLTLLLFTCKTRVSQPS